MIYAGLILLVLAVLALILANRTRAQAGLPTGRVIYADAGKWQPLERPLFDGTLGLTGKPDYLVEQNGALIPVEVKSSYAPPQPYDSHKFQLAAYCLLVEKIYGVRPPYGILHYRNRTFAIDYTPEMEAELRGVMAEIRQCEKLGEVERSHDETGRCVRCGYRSVCGERLG